MWHPNASFPSELASSSVSEKAKYFSNGFTLDHENRDRIFEKAKHGVLHPDQFGLLTLIGPTGVGKTELAEDIIRFCEQEVYHCREKYPVPAVYIQIPDPSKTTFDWKSLYLDALNKTGSPNFNLSRSKTKLLSQDKGRKYSGKYKSASDVKTDMIQRFQDANVMLMIMDELQNFFKFSEKEIMKCLTMLKCVEERIGCQVMLVGTYEAIESTSWTGEVSRRQTQLHFPRYTLNNGSKGNPFVSAFSGLLSHIPYQLTENLLSEKSIELAYIYSCGCIGTLKEMIQRALTKISESENQRFKISPEFLFSSRLENNQLYAIASEINFGEKFYEDKSLKDVRKMLGLIDHSKAEKSEDGKKTKPGERKPSRDLVGESGYKK